MHLPPNLLLVLAVVLQTRNVGTAALKLGMSQPSVSRALSRLREALGDPLLVRSGTSMARTRRGDELVERLSEWMVSTSTLLAEPAFDPARAQRRFRIASTDFGVMAVLIPAMARLRDEAPGIAIDVVPLSHAAHRGLANGEIDLAISGLDHDPAQLHALPLFEDRFVCVTRKDHPLAGPQAGAVLLEELFAYPHLALTVSEAAFDRVERRFAGMAELRRVAASIPYFGQAAGLLRAADLVMVVPSRLLMESVMADDLVTRPAPDAMGELAYRVLWHERSLRDSGSRWLRELLAAQCAAPPIPIAA
ncbi:LysR family transcriptional regulator [Novosphingobium sp. 9]|uniref:LysR family transcriptional regulator n=1 Tax=Novosphingobium sp. 9 TaxID=2025349 RepID=UPI0021B5F9E3|nr:LysR family transcriptional regulator [Novosphingobium sp. 9]